MLDANEPEQFTSAVPNEITFTNKTHPLELFYVFCILAVYKGDVKEFCNSLAIDYSTMSERDKRPSQVS
jgi:hypothetical protein